MGELHVGARAVTGGFKARHAPDSPAGQLGSKLEALRDHGTTFNLAEFLKKTGFPKKEAMNLINEHLKHEKRSHNLQSHHKIAGILKDYVLEQTEMPPSDCLGQLIEAAPTQELGQLILGVMIGSLGDDLTKLTKDKKDLARDEAQLAQDTAEGVPSSVDSAKIARNKADIKRREQGPVNKQLEFFKTLESRYKDALKATAASFAQEMASVVMPDGRSMGVHVLENLIAFSSSADTGFKDLAGKLVSELFGGKAGLSTVLEGLGKDVLRALPNLEVLGKGPDSPWVVALTQHVQMGDLAQCANLLYAASKKGATLDAAGGPIEAYLERASKSGEKMSVDIVDVALLSGSRKSEIFQLIQAKMPEIFVEGLLIHIDQMTGQNDIDMNSINSRVADNDTALERIVGMPDPEKADLQKARADSVQTRGLLAKQREDLVLLRKTLSPHVPRTLGTIPDELTGMGDVDVLAVHWDTSSISSVENFIVRPLMGEEILPFKNLQRRVERLARGNLFQRMANDPKQGHPVGGLLKHVVKREIHDRQEACSKIPTLTLQQLKDEKVRLEKEKTDHKRETYLAKKTYLMGNSQTGVCLQELVLEKNRDDNTVFADIHSELKPLREDIQKMIKLQLKMVEQAIEALESAQPGTNFSGVLSRPITPAKVILGMQRTPPGVSLDKHLKASLKDLTEELQRVGDRSSHGADKKERVAVLKIVTSKLPGLIAHLNSVDGDPLDYLQKLQNDLYSNVAGKHLHGGPHADIAKIIDLVRKMVTDQIKDNAQSAAISVGVQGKTTLASLQKESRVYGATSILKALQQHSPRKAVDEAVATLLLDRPRLTRLPGVSKKLENFFDTKTEGAILCKDVETYANVVVAEVVIEDTTLTVAEQKEFKHELVVALNLLKAQFGAVGRVDVQQDAILRQLQATHAAGDMTFSLGEHATNTQIFDGMNRLYGEGLPPTVVQSLAIKTFVNTLRMANLGAEDGGALNVKAWFHGKHMGNADRDNVVRLLIELRDFLQQNPNTLVVSASNLREVSVLLDLFEVLQESGQVIDRNGQRIDFSGAIQNYKDLLQQCENDSSGMESLPSTIGSIRSADLEGKALLAKLVSSRKRFDGIKDLYEQVVALESMGVPVDSFGADVLHGDLSKPEIPVGGLGGVLQELGALLGLDKEVKGRGWGKTPGQFTPSELHRLDELMTVLDKLVGSSNGSTVHGVRLEAALETVGVGANVPLLTRGIDSLALFDRSVASFETTWGKPFSFGEVHPSSVKSLEAYFVLKSEIETLRLQIKGQPTLKQAALVKELEEKTTKLSKMVSTLASAPRSPVSVDSDQVQQFANEQSRYAFQLEKLKGCPHLVEAMHASMAENCMERIKLKLAIPSTVKQAPLAVLMKTLEASLKQAPLADQKRLLSLFQNIKAFVKKEIKDLAQEIKAETADTAETAAKAAETAAKAAETAAKAAADIVFADTSSTLAQKAAAKKAVNVAKNAAAKASAKAAAATTAKAAAATTAPTMQLSLEALQKKKTSLEALLQSITTSYDACVGEVTRRFGIEVSSPALNMVLWGELRGQDAAFVPTNQAAVVGRLVALKGQQDAQLGSIAAALDTAKQPSVKTLMADTVTKMATQIMAAWVRAGDEPIPEESPAFSFSLEGYGDKQKEVAQEIARGLTDIFSENGVPRAGVVISLTTQGLTISFEPGMDQANRLVLVNDMKVRMTALVPTKDYSPNGNSDRFYEAEQAVDGYAGSIVSGAADLIAVNNAGSPTKIQALFGEIMNGDTTFKRIFLEYLKTNAPFDPAKHSKLNEVVIEIYNKMPGICSSQFFSSAEWTVIFQAMTPKAGGVDLVYAEGLDSIDYVLTALNKGDTEKNGIQLHAFLSQFLPDIELSEVVAAINLGGAGMTPLATQVLAATMKLPETMTELLDLLDTCQTNISTGQQPELYKAIAKRVLTNKACLDMLFFGDVSLPPYTKDQWSALIKELKSKEFGEIFNDKWTSPAQVQLRLLFKVSTYAQLALNVFVPKPPPRAARVAVAAVGAAAEYLAPTLIIARDNFDALYDAATTSADHTYDFALEPDFALLKAAAPLANEIYDVADDYAQAVPVSSSATLSRRVADARAHLESAYEIYKETIASPHRVGELASAAGAFRAAASVAYDNIQRVDVEQKFAKAREAFVAAIKVNPNDGVAKRDFKAAVAEYVKDMKVYLVPSDSDLYSLTAPPFSQMYNRAQAALDAVLDASSSSKNDLGYAVKGFGTTMNLLKAVRTTGADYVTAKQGGSDVASTAGLKEAAKKRDAALYALADSIPDTPANKGIKKALERAKAVYKQAVTKFYEQDTRNDIEIANMDKAVQVYHEAIEHAGNVVQATQEFLLAQSTFKQELEQNPQIRLPEKKVVFIAAVKAFSNAVMGPNPAGGLYDLATDSLRTTYEAAVDQFEADLPVILTVDQFKARVDVFKKATQAYLYGGEKPAVVVNLANPSYDLGPQSPDPGIYDTRDPAYMVPVPRNAPPEGGVRGRVGPLPLGAIRPGPVYAQVATPKSAYTRDIGVLRDARATREEKQTSFERILSAYLKESPAERANKAAVLKAIGDYVDTQIAVLSDPDTDIGTKNAAFENVVRGCDIESVLSKPTVVVAINNFVDVQTAILESTSKMPGEKGTALKMVFKAFYALKNSSVGFDKVRAAMKLGVGKVPSRFLELFKEELQKATSGDATYDDVEFFARIMDLVLVHFGEKLIKENSVNFNLMHNTLNSHLNHLEKESKSGNLTRVQEDFRARFEPKLKGLRDILQPPKQGFFSRRK